MRARHACIALLLVFGLGLMVGLGHERDRHRAELADLHASTAEAQRLAAHAATQRLVQAQQRGDQLTLQLADQARRIGALTQEKRDALKKATTGRACLGTAALRVLSGAPGLRVAGLPEATRSAAAAGGPVATDTDIGQWAVDAGTQYEQCRQRLGALIEWHGEQQ